MNSLAHLPRRCNPPCRPAPDVDPAALRKARDAKGLVSAATAAIAGDRHRDKETLGEFVAKKREMFLVQFSLDIKREEIARMEADASKREAAIDASTQQLEGDAVRFEAFLKENDEQAHDALKKAEAQTKIKAEKLHELKKLKHALGVVAAERGRLREVLDEFQSHKDFLDKLTPQEWKDERLAEQMELRKSRKLASFAAKLGAWEAVKAEKTSEVAAKVEADRKAALRRGVKPPTVDVDSLVSAQLPPPPLLEDEVLPQLSAEERELPLYFTEPQQLLSTFTQLEESNLFLIQNCQDIEQQLEELRQMHAETSAAIAVQTAQLEEQVAVLQGQLAQEEAKVAGLRKKAKAGAGAAQAESASSGENASALDALLLELRERIIGVYERCGFKATASSDTLSMLTALEGKLESLLASLAGLEPEYVSLKEKEKERERRVRVREARLEHAQEEHERKQKKMLERASAPVVKRTGKPDMSRSFLVKKEKKIVVIDPLAERKAEERKFGLA
jgi:hypothetical protein